jgi:hypothetical protein
MTEQKKEVSYQDWLTENLSENHLENYRHRRMDEVESLREIILPRLKQVVFEAHEDMRRHLRDIEGVSLDPLEIPPNEDPAEDYPGQKLHLTTLMGYFGEIFVGLFCEEFAPMGNTEWKVPAYLFRFHLDEDRHLDQIEQIGKNPNPDKELRFGRKGDDCLAFAMDEDGNITSALFCEAKCVSRHRVRREKKDEVSDAHEKLNNKLLIPVDRRRLIQILKDYPNDPDASKWIEALQRLRKNRVPEYRRFDLVCCIYGQKRMPGKTWIPKDQPHPSYTASRPLEAVEVYIRGIQEVVCEVYGKEI